MGSMGMRSIFQEIREKVKMAILAAFGKQGVNLACGTQNLQPQHHFSKTRHPSGQNDTNFNLLCTSTLFNR